jgi:hypothetical protein
VLDSRHSKAYGRREGGVVVVEAVQRCQRPRQGVRSGNEIPTPSLRTRYSIQDRCFLPWLPPLRNSDFSIASTACCPFPLGLGQLGLGRL